MILKSSLAISGSMGESTELSRVGFNQGWVFQVSLMKGNGTRGLRMYEKKGL